MTPLETARAVIEKQWKVESSILDGFEVAITVDTPASIGNIAHVRRRSDAERIIAAVNTLPVLTEEWFADVLQDSLEMDWTSSDGARAIMKALATLPAAKEG